MLILLSLIFLLFTPLQLALLSIPIIIAASYSPKIFLPFLLIFGALLGQEVFLFCVLSFFLTQKYCFKSNLYFPKSFHYFFLIMGLWLILDFYYLIEFSDLPSKLTFWGGLVWSDEWKAWIQSLIYFSNLYLVILSYQYFRNFHLTDFRFGILLALLISQGLLCYQIFVDPWTYGNQNQFWLSQDRYPSVYTDPNAFGLVSFLLFGLVFSIYKKSFYSKSLLLIILINFFGGFFSGSRSYFIAVTLLLLFLTFSYKKKLGVYFLCSLMLLVFFVNISIFTSTSNNQLVQYLTSESRILNSLNIQKIEETFFSRNIFNQLNFLIYQDYPIFGIGLNNFSKLMPDYSRYYQINIGSWVDNNNNFYFGLLTELGIVGFLAFCWAIHSFKVNWKGCNILVLTTLIFFIILFLGPHFYFTEVSVVFGLVLSQVIIERDRKILVPAYISKFLLIFIFVGILSNIRFQNRGLYEFENDQGSLFRWSKGKAQVYLDCSKLKSLRFEENHQSKISEIKVYRFYSLIFWPYLKEEKVNLNNNIFDCSNRNKFMIKLKVNQTWQPSKQILGSTDTRKLGVKIFYSMKSF